jgi:hypothetical protein
MLVVLPYKSSPVHAHALPALSNTGLATIYVSDADVSEAKY